MSVIPGNLPFYKPLPRKALPLMFALLRTLLGEADLLSLEPDPHPTVEREPVPSEVTIPEEQVEDISTWLDYDTIEAEFELDFEGDTNIEEAQPI